MIATYKDSGLFCPAIYRCSHWMKSNHRDENMDSGGMDRRTYRAIASQQLMADLLAHRLTHSRPFFIYSSGFAGPVYILKYKVHNKTVHKKAVADEKDNNLLPFDES
ncbi:hypothetical protein TNIN_442501 [Trichonephila inaurata madagascariensis]|uniref:Uncharacterized protein n=1 Tax=Trichonephila inaurata madagascariensis TaxID=2747483 RepID=A0A8X6XX74_9ARAC|nr:hypothetical protein TNIN_442501 [Trichonephila inaurata madagascariensis]